jgi:hypothetical protein
MSRKWYLAREIHGNPQAACAMIVGMKFLPKLGGCGCSAQDSEEMGSPAEAQDADFAALGAEDSKLLKTVGWVSAALGVVALGLLVGRELRQRYKFNRRTPYDLYSHSGDELPDVDCGVGI